MFSTSVFLVCFLYLINLSTATTPVTSCTTIGDNSQHTRSYTRTVGCTNTHTRLRQATSTATPVTTSIVYSVSVVTVSGSPDTATYTVTDTVTANSTTLEIDTTTATSTSIFTVTSSYPARPLTTKIPPPELKIRAESSTKPPIGKRPTPTPGVVCIVNKCSRRRVTSTSTVTTSLPTSTATSTSIITSTSTPNATTTITTTQNFTSIATITLSSTTTITTVTVSTTTYTPIPTFYVLSNGSPSIPDGTHGGLNDGSFLWVSDLGAIFFLDPATGLLTDSEGEIAAGYSGYSGGQAQLIQFDTYANIVDSGANLCNCSLEGNPDGNPLDLKCDCGGLVFFENLLEYADLKQGSETFLFIADPNGYDECSPACTSETPTVLIIDQN